MMKQGTATVLETVEILHATVIMIIQGQLAALVKCFPPAVLVHKLAQIVLMLLIVEVVLHANLELAINADGILLVMTTYVLIII